MSDIKLTQIIAPELGSDSYGANIKKQFENIDNNFTQIVEGEYLKGQSGDIVMLEEIDLIATKNHEIRKAFDDFIGGLQVGENGIGDINSSKLYMIYTLNQENEEKIYKTSLPYTFLDPRFNPVPDNPVVNNEKDNESMDKSCIIMYDGEKFVSYNAFPNIYFNEEQNEFCWKINGLPTPLPARGPRGEIGYAGSFYILQAEKSNMEGGYHKVSFIITPNNHKGYLGVIKGEGLVSELEGQCAFVCHENAGYLATIESLNLENEIYAVCSLDPSLNVYNIFSGESLADTLKNNTVEKNGYGSLFLPVKESNGEVLAHTLTTKLSNDRVGEYQKYHGTTKKEDLVLSPGIFKKTNAGGQTKWVRSLVPADVALAAPFEFINNYPVSRFLNEVTIGEHIEGDTPSASGNLTVYDKAFIGCKSSYKDEKTGQTKPYNFGELWVGSTINIGDNTGVLRTGEIQIGEIPWIFSTQRTSEYISILKLSTPEIPEGSTKLFKIDSIVDIPRILSTSIDSLHALSASIDSLDALSASIDSLDALSTSIDSLHVKSVWPSQQSLFIPYGEVNNPIQAGDIMPETFVYLTWGSFDVEIPHQTDSNYSDAEHKYLSLGDSQYLLYTYGPKSSITSRKYIPSMLNLTFDLSKPIPYTVIDVSCDSPLKSISFARGNNVNIYCSGFNRWSENEDTEIIKVENGKVKTINFDAAPKQDDDGNYVEDENGELIFETLVYDKIILSPITADDESDHSMDYMLSIESRDADSLDRFISNIAESKWVSIIKTNVETIVTANTLSLGQFNRIAKEINLPQASTFSLRSTPVQTEEVLDSDQVAQNFIDTLNGRLDPDTLADSLVTTKIFALADSTANLNTNIENLRVDLEEYKGKIFDTYGNFKPSVIKDAFDDGDDNPFIFNTSTNKLQLKSPTVSAATVQSLFKLDGSNNSPFVLDTASNMLEFNYQILNNNTDFQELINDKVILQIGKTSGLTPSTPTIDTSNFVKQGDLAGYMTKSDFNSEKIDLNIAIQNVKQSIQIPTWETLQDRPTNILTEDEFETQILKRGIVTSKNFVTNFENSKLSNQFALKTDLKWSSITDKPTIPTSISDLTDAKLLTEDEFKSSFDGEFARNIVTLGIVTNETVGTLMTSATSEALENNPTFNGMMKSLYKTSPTGFEKDADGNYVLKVLTDDNVSVSSSGDTLTIGSKIATIPTIKDNIITYGSKTVTVPTLSTDGKTISWDSSSKVTIPSVSLTDDTLTINGTKKTLFDGDYNSLDNQPTIPTIKDNIITYGSKTVTVPTVSLIDDTLTINGTKKTLFDGDYNSLDNQPTIPTIKDNTITYGSSSLTVAKQADLISLQTNFDALSVRMKGLITDKSLRHANILENSQLILYKVANGTETLVQEININSWNDVISIDRNVLSVNTDYKLYICFSPLKIVPIKGTNYTLKKTLVIPSSDTLNVHPCSLEETLLDDRRYYAYFTTPADLKDLDYTITIDVKSIAYGGSDTYPINQLLLIAIEEGLTWVG